MKRARWQNRTRRSGGLVLAAALALASLSPAHAAGSPRFAVKLIDFAGYDDALEAQIVAINQELDELEKRLPGIEVVADLWPPRTFEYQVAFRTVESEEDSLALEASFRGPGFELDILAQYADPCTGYHRRTGVRCEPATLEERAAGVVADLFDLTVNDRSRGLYRPFEVVHCDRRGAGRVRMQVASKSVMESYKVPHSWFRYRPGVVAGAVTGEPEPVEVLLRPRTLDHDGYVVFLCEAGSIEALAPYCPNGEAGVDARGAGGSDGPRIVLEHRYPGRHLLPPPVLSPPVGVNQAPAATAEPR